MSFEENASEALDLSQNWVLNAGSQSAACNDRWMVGNSVHSDGRRSLYIVSSDTLTVPCFGKPANLQFAYRDFKLPAGSYYLSFDWLNAANADALLRFEHTHIPPQPLPSRKSVVPFVASYYDKFNYKNLFFCHIYV